MTQTDNFHPIASAYLTSNHSLNKPVRLKFERVFKPLLLQEVNRYAGYSYAPDWNEGQAGDLVVKVSANDRVVSKTTVDRMFMR